MTVLYHPEFPRDIRRFASHYGAISAKIEQQFIREIDSALAAVITNPTAAGHFLNTGSVILREVRRRNLAKFPFFILYGLADDRLVVGSLIPSTSAPLAWLDRFSPTGPKA